MIAEATRIGPYELVSTLGVGGMGEVWRARDPRLGRDVALKLLSADLRDDPERLRRFELEARATGALSHPNILAVHDFGEHEGTPYLVSELLEGETLRARLRRGPVPPRKAIEIAVQIARGLAAAHAKGIVHRDLKPENLFVAPDGRTKILDFGLAKPIAPGAFAGPTLSEGTAAGAILGSVGYMAPEQVRGQPADARSDIFALGAVLHEMIAGTRAFDAPTPVEVGYATLNRDPPELVGASEALRRVVRRCLEKAPGERFQSADDLAFALESLVGASSSTGRAPGGPRRSALGSALAVFVTLGLVVAGALVWQARGRATVRPTAATARAEVAVPRITRVSYRLGTIGTSRFADDGRSVVFAAALEGQPWQVYLATPGQPEARPLSEPWTGLFGLSKAGDMALAAWPEAPGHEWSLARASIAGGAPRIVAAGVLAADYRADGSLLMVTNREGRQRLEWNGRVLFDTDGAIGMPRFSPSGDAIAFLHWPILGDDRGTVEVVNLDDGAKKVLSGPWFTLHGLAWAPSGREIWYAAGQRIDEVAIRAVTLDRKDRAVYRGLGDLSIEDIAPDGRVLVRSCDGRFRAFGVRGGGATEPLSWFDYSIPADLTPDGRLLLLTEGVAAAGRELQAFLRPTDGAPAVHISEGFARALTPDGQWAIVSTEPPFTSLTLVPTGAGQPRRLPAGDFTSIGRVYCFAGGDRILIVARKRSGSWGLWVQDLATGPPREVVLQGRTLDASHRKVSGIERATAPSPDGRWTAAVDVDRRPVLINLETGEERELPGLDVNTVPVQWSADGRSLYIIELSDNRPEFPTRILRYDMQTQRKTPWQEIEPQERAGISARTLHALLIVPDGRYFVYGYQRELDDLYVMEGLR